MRGEQRKALAKVSRLMGMVAIRTYAWSLTSNSSTIRSTLVGI